MEDLVTLDCDRRRARGAWLCLAALFAFATIVATLLLAQPRSPARTAKLLLIYVGAEDCAPCRAWHGGDGAAFRNSADFNRLTYREVRSPQLRNVIDDEYWPEDIRGYRDHLKRGDGVPLWLIVLGNKVVEEEFGAAAWRSKILPRISFALRQAPPIRAEFPGMGAHSH
jgi:hypothetical protein